VVVLVTAVVVLLVVVLVEVQHQILLVLQELGLQVKDFLVADILVEDHHLGDNHQVVVVQVVPDKLEQDLEHRHHRQDTED